MYKADRDEYDALLGRKMAERDALAEQFEAARNDATHLRLQLEHAESDLRQQEGYPGIAHDLLTCQRARDALKEQLEALREALATIGDLRELRLTHEGAKKRARAALTTSGEAKQKDRNLGAASPEDSNPASRDES